MIMLSVRLLLRVLCPLVGTPHGVTGCRPPELRPSPPPSGGSTGVINTPRVCGPGARPAGASGLADLLVHVVGVGNRADARHALGAHHTQLARHELDLRVAG